MSTSTMVKELPETSKWHGAISDEDVQLVRRRHAEKVEEWLDFADFATELFALHEKYGIEKGEEGYFAYRKHLRTNYDHKLATYGPTPDPLDERCECIFCKMHPVEPSDDSDQSLNHQQPEPEPEPKPSVASCTDHPPANNHHIIRSHYRPHPSPNKNSQTKSRLGLVPAEPPNNSQKADRQETKKTNDAIQIPYVAGCADHPPANNHHIISSHYRPYPSPNKNSQTKSRLGLVPAEPPNDHNPSNYQNDRSKKLGPVPAYLATARRPPSKKIPPTPFHAKATAERPWLQKMAGSVF